MPTYEYQCKACDHKFELFQKVSDPAPKACPECRKGPINKVFTSVGIIFKGSGFYVTDYKKDAKKDAARSETGEEKAEPKKGADDKTPETTVKTESGSETGSSGESKGSSDSKSGSDSKSTASSETKTSGEGGSKPATTSDSGDRGRGREKSGSA